MTPGSASPLLLDAAAGGYQISRSIRLRSSASAYLSRTFSSGGNRKTWTFSAWVKRGAFTSNPSIFGTAPTSGAGNVYFVLGFSGDAIRFEDYNGAVTGKLQTTQVFRDPASWYHIVAVFDTSNATASDRMRLYVNGQRVSTFTTNTTPALNLDGQTNNAAIHSVGAVAPVYVSGYEYDGYMTEINFIDGQALTPSSFGQTDTTTGVWTPKKYTGSYGTNGFYLNFSDNSAATAAAIGKDSSGNGNNWTPNNISVTAGSTYDSMIDTPTPYDDGGNGRGNYPVANPLWKAATIYIDDGNLRLQPTGSGVGAGWRSNFPMPSSTGKWYYEVTVQTVGAGSQLNHVAIGDQFYAFDLSSGSFYYYRSDGNISGTTGYATFSNGSIIGVALDTVAATLSFYHNGTLQRTITSVGISTDWWPGGLIPAGAGAVSHVNFGQRPFAYTPPSGFKALNTQNLPTPTIVKPHAWFDAITYIGNDPGTNTVAQTISGLNFQPDFLWIKNRNNANPHALFDAVRGAGKKIQTDTTAAEQTSGFDTSQTFNANGFTTGKADDTNKGPSGYGFIAWNWKEGATPGFDIVTYTGPASPAAQNVAHNLGVKPEMMIVKARNLAGRNWAVYHKELGATQCLRLNLTSAAASVSTYWNNTEPTSTQFTVGTDNDTNANTYNYVAYLFAGVEGFSKFGKYTGNGSADGPFVYCGFRPRFILVKNASAAYGWDIGDSARSPYNENELLLYANVSNAEATNTVWGIDYLSNGFKIRTDGQVWNQNSNTYIFAAFAENPFKYALAR